jgi:NTE family protein
MGTVATTTITRIVREGALGEPSSRDYDFSRAAVSRNLEQGYRLTLEALRQEAENSVLRLAQEEGASAEGGRRR